MSRKNKPFIQKSFHKLASLMLMTSTLTGCAASGLMFMPSPPPPAFPPSYPSAYPTPEPMPYPADSRYEALNTEARVALQEQALNLLLLNSDTNRDQQLTLDEFNFGLLPMRLFERVDRNSDGKVDREELWSYQQQLNLHTSQRQRDSLPRLFPSAGSVDSHTRSAFVHGDTDQDQQLDFQELKQAFAQVAVYYDADASVWGRDGRLGPLSEALLNHADTDDNDRLSGSELSGGLWKLFRQKSTL